MEQVLVVDRGVLAPYIQGGKFSSIAPLGILSCINDNYYFMDRTEAEQNSEVKQIIPYILVKFEDKYLLSRRFKAQTEKRLHGKLSIGLGGHINDTDRHASDMIAEGLIRELNEEINIGSFTNPEFVGIINDDENEVGKYHLGIVFEISSRNGIFEVIEKEKMTAEWAGIKELKENYTKMETWSQIAFDKYIITEAF